MACVNRVQEMADRMGEDDSSGLGLLLSRLAEQLEAEAE